MQINANILQQLRAKPDKSITARLGTSLAVLHFGIADYQSKLASHYGLSREMFAGYQHFGLVINFENDTELVLHDDEMNLSSSTRELLRQFGPVVMRNVHLPSTIASVGHRNRFPHLKFHRDRNKSHATPYSLFYRDPFDAEQRHPRTSSTLFISLEHARIELQRNGCGIGEDEDLSHCMLFTDVNDAELRQHYMGEMILEQPWDLAEGTGEICIQDNRQLLHSSYYRNVRQDGYRIGVRYLG